MGRPHCLTHVIRASTGASRGLGCSATQFFCVTVVRESTLDLHPPPSLMGCLPSKLPAHVSVTCSGKGSLGRPPSRGFRHASAHVCTRKVEAGVLQLIALQQEALTVAFGLEKIELVAHHKCRPRLSRLHLLQPNVQLTVFCAAEVSTGTETPAPLALGNSAPSVQSVSSAFTFSPNSPCAKRQASGSKRAA